MKAIPLTGVHTNNPSLQRVAADPILRRAGNLPALRAWVSPEPAFNEGGTRFERIDGKLFNPVNSPTANGAINGKAAFNFVSDGVWRYLANDDEATSSMPNPDTAAYTVMTVLRANMAQPTLQTPIASAGVIRNGLAQQIQILLGVGTGSIGVAHNIQGQGEAILGTEADAIDLSKNILLMVTYGNGIAKMFVDDVLKVSGPLAAINPRGMLLGAAGNNVRQYYGTMGDVMWFGADYSMPGMEVARAALVQTYRSMFSLT